MKRIKQILKCFSIAIMLLATGCVSNDIVVDPIQPWEGHYKTVDEFKQKTADIQLEHNESIWVLSNNTLKRVIKNQQNSQNK